MAICLTLQNYLGALDGTYIKVNVSQTDRARYKTRKGEVATNVLRVYNSKGDFDSFWQAGKDLQLIRTFFKMRLYSQTDYKSPRIFTISTPPTTFKTSYITAYNPLCNVIGFYYLHDIGYPNAKGFLASYKSQRYHLQERRGVRNAPTAVKE
ncbi:putative nuclease HARBI1 [Cucumis melo var. makuwa]|uniref:Nuclease HARBI1 n=1 Tax=Cucumis melo var. makuwa TaxID=1194695 RepID=A0A5D3CQK7_CUCMM|nr:putative nuclease HARBI1 [Cucumis melo var. makuwa]TYK14143.1 putative nuclease HARBI1 [Cucumis melo var. makuwa]